MTVTYLDLVRAARERVTQELEAIGRETSPVLVLGVYYANPYDAAIQRGRIVDRCMRDLERLDAAIARLTLAPDAAVLAAMADPDDPCPQDACDAGIDGDDEIVGTPDYEFWFGPFDRAGDVPADKHNDDRAATDTRVVA